MASYYFSKSRYCSAIQCPKILWLNEHLAEEESDDGEEINEPVLQIGLEVGNVAKGLLGRYKEVPYSDNRVDMISITEKLIEAGEKKYLRSFIQL